MLFIRLFLRRTARIITLPVHDDVCNTVGLPKDPRVDIRSSANQSSRQGLLLDLIEELTQTVAPNTNTYLYNKSSRGIERDQ